MCFINFNRVILASSDAPHSDHPPATVTEETFNAVPAMIEDDSH